MKKKSLMQNLMLHNLSVIGSVTLLFLILITVYTGVILRDERDNAERSLMSHLPAILARDVSVGDYARVESRLSDDALPNFVTGITISNSDGTKLLEWKKTEGTCNRVKKLVAPINSPSFGFYSSAESQSLTVFSEECSIVASQIRLGLLTILMGLLVTVVAAAFVRRVVNRALQPVIDLAHVAPSAEDLISEASDKAPKELVPFIESMNTLYQRFKRVDEEKQRFAIAKRVAHDLRSPLSALFTLSSLIQFRDNDQRALFESAVKRVDGISEDLLKSSKAVESPLRNTVQDSLKSLLRETAVIFPEIKVQFKDHVSKAVAVPGKVTDFERNISNILKNAVEVDTRGHIDVVFSFENNVAFVEVHDRGSGFPNEILYNLNSSQPVELSTKSSGNGIGLISAKQYFESLGGNLHLSNRDDGGAVVIASFRPAT